MTTTFYAPPDSIRGSHITLPEDEAHHAIRVLRKQAGDEIVVVDGVGGRYQVRLDRVGDRKAMGTVLETHREVGEPTYDLTLGLGLLKNRNRFETFLEKAVELGVTAIVPLQTARTEKLGLKKQRAEKILLAAMKQCGRSRLPELVGPTPFAEALPQPDFDRQFICHERAPASTSLQQALGSMPAGPTLRILVGPEGGFTPGEVAAAEEEGALPVGLGRRRLRAETAAIVAATAAHLTLGAKGGQSTPTLLG
jgi:16S rRNA (uracil1498-N3)-methyltransferase